MSETRATPEPPVTREVRRELRRLVREDPRTQEDLAAELKISAETLTRRLTGRARLLFEDAEALLPVLGRSELHLAEVVRLACVRLGAQAPVAFGGALILPADPTAPEWSQPHSAGPSRWCPRCQAEAEASKPTTGDQDDGS